MTLARLREATDELAEKFVADHSRPLAPTERAHWEAIRVLPQRPALVERQCAFEAALREWHYAQ